MRSLASARLARTRGRASGALCVLPADCRARAASLIQEGVIRILGVKLQVANKYVAWPIDWLTMPKVSLQ